MADQTTMNGSTATPHGYPAGPQRGNLADLFHDLTKLFELQLKLLTFDLKEGMTRSAVALVTLVIGGVLMLACFPVALLAIGYWIAAATTLGMGTSLAIVSMAGLIIALGMAGWAGWRLRRSFNVVRRSQEELVHNLHWIQAALKSHGSAERPSPIPPEVSNRYSRQYHEK